MMNASTIYWITRLDAIKGFLGASLGFVLVVTSVAWFVYIVDAKFEEGELPELHTVAKRATAVLFLVTLLFELIPSTKEMAAAIVIPRLAESEYVQSLGEDVKDAVRQWVVDLPKNKMGTHDHK